MADSPPRGPQAMSGQSQATVFSMKLNRETAAITKRAASKFIAEQLKNSGWLVESEIARNPQSKIFCELFLKRGESRIILTLSYSVDQSIFSVGVNRFSKVRNVLRAIAGVLTLVTFIVALIYVPYRLSPVPEIAFVLMMASFCEIVISCVVYLSRTPDVDEIENLFSRVQTDLACILTDEYFGEGRNYGK
jgi:hypothetical protein